MIREPGGVRDAAAPAEAAAGAGEATMLIDPVPGVPWPHSTPRDGEPAGEALDGHRRRRAAAEAAADRAESQASEAARRAAAAIAAAARAAEEAEAAAAAAERAAERAEVERAAEVAYTSRLPVVPLAEEGADRPAVADLGVDPFAGPRPSRAAEAAGPAPVAQPEVAGPGPGPHAGIGGPGPEPVRTVVPFPVRRVAPPLAPVPSRHGLDPAPSAGDALLPAGGERTGAGPVRTGGRLLARAVDEAGPPAQDEAARGSRPRHGRRDPAGSPPDLPAAGPQGPAEAATELIPAVPAGEGTSRHRRRSTEARERAAAVARAAAQDPDTAVIGRAPEDDLTAHLADGPGGAPRHGRPDGGSAFGGSHPSGSAAAGRDRGPAGGAERGPDAGGARGLGAAADRGPGGGVDGGPDGRFDDVLDGGFDGAFDEGLDGDRDRDRDEAPSDGPDRGPDGGPDEGGGRSGAVARLRGALRSRRGRTVAVVGAAVLVVAAGTAAAGVALNRPVGAASPSPVAEAAPATSAAPAADDAATQVDPQSPKAVAFLKALRKAGVPVSTSGLTETEAAALICARIGSGTSDKALARSLPAVLPTVTDDDAPAVVGAARRTYC